MTEKNRNTVFLPKIPLWIENAIHYNHEGNNYKLNTNIGEQNILRYLDSNKIKNFEEFVDFFVISYSFNYSLSFRQREWVLNYPIILYDFVYENLGESLLYIPKILDRGVNTKYVLDFYDTLKMYKPITIDIYFKNLNGSYKLKFKMCGETTGKFKFHNPKCISQLITAVKYNREMKYTENNSYISYKHNTINFKSTDVDDEFRSSSSKFKIHVTKYNYDYILEKLGQLTSEL